MRSHPTRNARRKKGVGTSGFGGYLSLRAMICLSFRRLQSVPTLPSSVGTSGYRSPPPRPALIFGMIRPLLPPTPRASGATLSPRRRPGTDPPDFARDRGVGATLRWSPSGTQGRPPRAARLSDASCPLKRLSKERPARLNLAGQCARRAREVRLNGLGTDPRRAPRQLRSQAWVGIRNIPGRGLGYRRRLKPGRRRSIRDRARPGHRHCESVG